MHIRRIALVAVAALLAIPAVSLATGRHQPRPFVPVYTAPDAPVLRVLTGVATADATAEGVTISTCSARYRAPWGGAVTVRFDAETRFKGQASAFGDIKAGDRVQISVVAPRNARPADYPAADTVVDMGAAPVASPEQTLPPVLRHSRQWVMWGRVVVAPDASAATPTFQMRVRAANRVARKALRRERTRVVTVTIDPAGTRIRIVGEGRGEAADIEQGDRVRVEWRAPRVTPLSALPAAKRVKVFF